MSEDLVKVMLGAAGRASIILLSALGAIFLLANTIAWLKGGDIVIASQNRPAIAVFLLSWLAIMVAIAAAKWWRMKSGEQAGKAARDE